MFILLDTGGRLGRPKSWRPRREDASGAPREEERAELTARANVRADARSWLSLNVPQNNMQTKAQWITRVAVWATILVGAVIASIARGDMSARGLAASASCASFAWILFGGLYFMGGVFGDAFPPHTAVDANAALGLRGQPLDHGRGALVRPTFGGVVIVAAAVAAVLASAIWYLVSR